MIEEFDKGMDVLLRQAAQGETAFAAENLKSAIQNPKSFHLDADEISLFAENALPPKLRENAVLHFADCDRCRRILSDLIAETPANEIVSAAQTEVFAPVIPWYRKLFAFPNLVYTLGALVLVFSGLVALTIVQSVDNAKNTEISRVSERPIGAQGMSSDGDAAIVERNADTTMSNMSSNSAMANAASMSNSTAARSSNQMTLNTSASFDARNSNANSASNGSAASNKSSASAIESPKNEPPAETELAKKAENDSLLRGAIANNPAQEKRDRAKAEGKVAETTDKAQAAPPLPQSVQPPVSKNKALSDAPGAEMRRARPAESAAISTGGKNFRRENGVYIDSTYKGQATTGVTRGTKEYKKLDSGLRGIVENLGGTVIVVWKDKAYRIQ